MATRQIVRFGSVRRTTFAAFAGVVLLFVEKCRPARLARQPSFASRKAPSVDSLGIAVLHLQDDWPELEALLRDAG
jgi:hypothetical protein